MLPHIAGQYYITPTVKNSGSSATPVINQLYLIPFVVPTDGNYDRISAHQTGAGASNYRLGIYGPITTTLNSLPLILDSGLIALAAAGPVEATISQPLAAGWYFLAFLTDTARTMSGISEATNIAELGQAAASTLSPPKVATAAHAFAALPSPGPNNPSLSALGTSSPIVALRKA